MCGIVGYIGRDRAGSVMLDGLKRLEYRGYDSSGVATWTENGIKQTKRTGRVIELETVLVPEATRS
jgi:glucosamine--fructose-6-phosphate aminotransferase (isomerizing)